MAEFLLVERSLRPTLASSRQKPLMLWNNRKGKLITTKSTAWLPFSVIHCYKNNSNRDWLWNYQTIVFLLVSRRTKPVNSFTSPCLPKLIFHSLSNDTSLPFQFPIPLYAPFSLIPIRLTSTSMAKLGSCYSDFGKDCYFLLAFREIITYAREYPR